MNNADFWVSAVMTGMAILLLLPVIYDFEVAIMLMLWYLVLGFYQMLSALIGSIRGSVVKRWYFFAGIIVSFGFISGLDHTFGRDTMKWFQYFILVLPTGMAILYTKLCYDAKIRTAL